MRGRPARMLLLYELYRRILISWMCLLPHTVIFFKVAAHNNAVLELMQSEVAAAETPGVDSDSHHAIAVEIRWYAIPETPGCVGARCWTAVLLVVDARGPFLKMQAQIAELRNSTVHDRPIFVESWPAVTELRIDRSVARFDAKLTVLKGLSN